MKTHLLITLLLVAFLFCESAALAAKKDFKGLFGSYRRDKYTENEGHSTDWGMDIMLSTLLPMSPLIKSIETRGGASDNLSYSTFFNVEGSLFMTLNYHWEAFLNFGYYTYETRKENALTRNNPALQPTPIFHEFSLTAYPIVLGARYRFSREDIVPYVGLGGGFAFASRKGSYDNDPTGAKTDTDSNTVLAAQGIAGLEFFLDSRMGIRLEIAALLLGLSARTYDYSAGVGAVDQNPILEYQANPISVRYASGIFILF